MNRSCNQADKGCYFITSANLVEAKEEEKIADPCDRKKMSESQTKAGNQKKFKNLKI